MANENSARQKPVSGALLLYWVATYGNNGLEVEHFTNKKDASRAVREAHKEHSQGRLDSYTSGYEDVSPRAGRKPRKAGRA